ncbi:MAG: hypothetical protein ACHQJX_10115 [Candidatus Acidiferrales bacterium]|jgi:hypothetical protein
MTREFRRFVGTFSLLAGLFFFAGASVRASVPQDQPQDKTNHRRGMQSPDERLQMLTKQLNLTDDEQAKIKPILVDEQKKMEDLRSDSTLSQQDRFQKMRDIREDSSKQIRSNLDENQQKKFDDMQKEQQKRMQERRNSGGGPGPGASLN